MEAFWNMQAYRCQELWSVWIVCSLFTRKHADCSLKVRNILKKPSSVLQACLGLSEHLTSENFLGEHTPRPPYSCMLMHAYIHIRHPCKPPFEYPGYGPVFLRMSRKVSWASLRLPMLLLYLSELCVCWNDEDTTKEQNEFQSAVSFSKHDVLTYWCTVRIYGLSFAEAQISPCMCALLHVHLLPPSL